MLLQRIACFLMLSFCGRIVPIKAYANAGSARSIFTKSQLTSLMSTKISVSGVDSPHFSAPPGSSVIEEQPCKVPINSKSCVLVVGGSRGLGLEFVNQLLTKGATVIATHREASPPSSLQALCSKYSTDDEPVSKLRTLGMDVGNEESILRAKDRFVSNPRYFPKLTHIIHNAGVYGPRIKLGEIDQATMMDVFRINAVGPMLVAQTFATDSTAVMRIQDDCNGGGPPILSILTSKVGSIDDNSGGGGYIYRASKAAANMIGKSLAIDLAGRVQVVLLHPGYVRTDMTGGNGLIDASESVQGMLRAIEATAVDTPFRWVDYKACRIPW